jgi:NSS family neurotransmitter:Na+ symporter
LGLAVVYSFGPDTGLQWFGKRNLLGVLDAVTANLLLPLVSLLITLFVGWRLRPEILRLELARESALFFSLWRFLLRYIAPPAIVLLMLAPLLVARV